MASQLPRRIIKVGWVFHRVYNDVYDDELSQETERLLADPGTYHIKRKVCEDSL